MFIRYHCEINVREGPMKSGQSRETDSRRRQTMQKHNTIYVGHHSMQTNSNNVDKTQALLQTTGGK